MDAFLFGLRITAAILFICFIVCLALGIFSPRVAVVQTRPVKCPRCGTQYLEPMDECDWCPGVKPGQGDMG